MKELKYQVFYKYLVNVQMKYFMTLVCDLKEKKNGICH